MFLHMTHRQRQVGRANPDRTEIIAGHARKAAVHLFDEVGAELEFPLQAFARERHAAARRRRFRAVFAVRRTGGKAQSAADTIVILGFFRLLQFQDQAPLSPRS